MPAHEPKPLSRRDLFRTAAAIAGAGIASQFRLVNAEGASIERAVQGAAADDPLTAMRNYLGAVPIQTTPLGSNLTMLSGPGGNVVVLTGPDGKIVVDSFVQPAWPKLKTLLDGMGGAPIELLIDTHWHVDHADNNANFRNAGAAVLAHENTRKRLSEPHELLGMHLEPFPAAALPGQTFADAHTLYANSETVEVGYIPPAHTDTDVYVRYAKANVLHLGDVFFNGAYPFIDAGTGGSIGGMIAGADKALGLADAQTKIVPGHGPLGDKAALVKYRDVLVIARDKVQALKAKGQTLEQVLTAKPTADLDAVWGQGFMKPEQFLAIVYATVK